MTGLRDAVLAILESEREYPPLSAESLSRVLFYTGAGQTVERIPVTAIEGALGELMALGAVEAVHSMRLGKRYRAARSVQVGSVKAC